MNIKFSISFILIFYLLYIGYFLIFGYKNNTSVTFFDVGQGDAVYIHTSKGRVILIDGGADFSVDEKYSQISSYPLCEYYLIILTHRHADHSVGLDRLNTRCPNNIITFNDISSVTKDGFKNYPELEKKLSKIKMVGTNLTFEIDDIKFYILWPNTITEKIYIKNAEENDRSLVIFAVYKNSTVLLTGDVSGEILAKLDWPVLENFIKPGVDILKVSHHGSITGLDENVLKLLHPKNCIISVGKNSFGHPDPRVVKFLVSNGCKIWRTDFNGDIEFDLGTL